MIQRTFIHASLLFLAVCFRVILLNAILTNAEVGRTHKLVHQHISNVTKFAWSSWGTWSPCSKSCGGGISVQERHCLPRDITRLGRGKKRRNLPPNEQRPRRDSLVQSSAQCIGLAKRYHECNTFPCPGKSTDSRADQCAAYDRRPFRGRFYTWTPYVEGDAPCLLNCRPRGQQFYATLGLVADGTPCTKPGFRAICVEGTCQVVGRNGVMSLMSDHEAHCGRRLVSGLFSRPQLPLGYSLVTTVPRGACRLNISEIAPSDNFIALKITNGTYIMNGEFAVSAPGVYEAVGARFHYSRIANLDNVFADGPIQHNIDIMILYTQPNPSIMYEFLTDLKSEDEASPNKAKTWPSHRHYRHHKPDLEHIKERKSDLLKTTLESADESTNEISQGYHNFYRKGTQNNFTKISTNYVGDRKFTWKILAFTTCSRTCGGGLQIGKFKCVEVGVNGHNDREISPMHCTGAPPPSRRRRCGAMPCEPRWRAAAWGPCPACGPARRTRIVGCVQDHARGITKISNHKCVLPMPEISELCKIPNCDVTMTTTESTQDFRRQVHGRHELDSFRDSLVLTNLNSNTSPNKTDHVRRSNYSFSASGGWLHTEWSTCTGSCAAGGVQTRGVRCSEPGGCTKSLAPTNVQYCKPRQDCDSASGEWFTGDWSKCSALCDGQQVRGAICISGMGRVLNDAACGALKPETKRACGGNCGSSWYLSDWGECTGLCSAGIQTRTVWCARGGLESASGAARDSECSGTRPQARRTCVPPRCSSRPTALRPAVLASNDSQSRVIRHQAKEPQNVDVKERSYAKTDGAVCEDKLNNCALAQQARLCHYKYYELNCCRSCRGR